MKIINFIFTNKKKYLISYQYLKCSELVMKMKENKTGDEELLNTYKSNFYELIKNNYDFSSCFTSSQQIEIFNYFLDTNEDVLYNFVLMIANIIVKKNGEISLSCLGKTKILDDLFGINIYIFNCFIEKMVVTNLPSKHLVLFMQFFVQCFKNPFVRSILTKYQKNNILICSKYLDDNNNDQTVIKHCLKLFKAYLVDKDSIQILLLKPKILSSVINNTKNENEEIKTIANDIINQITKPQSNNNIGLLKYLTIDVLFFLLKCENTEIILPRIMMALLYNLNNLIYPLANRLDDNCVKCGAMYCKNNNDTDNDDADEKGWKYRYCILYNGVLYEYKIIVPMRRASSTVDVIVDGVKSVVTTLTDIFKNPTKLTEIGSDLVVAGLELLTGKEENKLNDDNEYTIKNDINCKLLLTNKYIIHDYTINSIITEDNEQAFMLEKKSENSQLELPMSVTIKGYNYESTKRWGRTIQMISI